MPRKTVTFNSIFKFSYFWSLVFISLYINELVLISHLGTKLVHSLFR